MKFFLLLLFFIFLSAQNIVLEGVSALVGNTLILKSDVSQMVSMTALQQKIDLNKNPDLFSLLQDQALGLLIDRQVILEMAILDSVEVKDKEVDDALDRQIETIISQAGNVSLAEEYLGQSIKSFRRDFWTDMQDRLITEQYQFSLLSKINISRGEVIRFYEDYKDSLGFLPALYRVNHIQLAVKPGDTKKSDALSAINDLRYRITSGESFHSLAIAHSEDHGSAPVGGDLGYVQRGALVTEFESIAFTQEVGVVSNPILTKFGYHLIETMDKQGEKARIRHILIKPKITESDETRAYDFALTLKDSITNLDTFKYFANKYSDDKSTKNIGGNLGWIDVSNFPIPEFSYAIKNLSSLDECSLPLKTSVGYHLIWMSGIRPGGKPNLFVHWPEVEALALNHKKGVWFQGWLGQAKSVLYTAIYKNP